MGQDQNPFIVDFCRALIARKGEKLSPEAESKLTDDLYRLFENLLGQNLVAALPDQVRQDYLEGKEAAPEDVDWAQLGRIFGRHVERPDEVMAKTVRQLEELYFRNR